MLSAIFLKNKFGAMRMHIALRLLQTTLLLLCAKGNSANARSLASVRPDSYRVEVFSSRSDNRPRVVNVWAQANVDGEPYRALMPPDFIQGKEVEFDFRWSAGAPDAGQSQKVEMQWKWKAGDVWKSTLLGEGFRDPQSGQLIVVPAILRWGEPNSGFISMRFLIHSENGQIRQDGGPGAELQFQLGNREPTALLHFSDQWSTGVQGELIAGETFEIEYSPSRMEQQFGGPSDGLTPWCLQAKIQFDDGPVQSVSLLANHQSHAEKVVPFIPTLSIPRSARRMTLWFVSFHNAVSYFDSNFGANYHFVIRQP